MRLTMDQFKERQSEIGKLLRSPGGKALLEHLEREFDPDALFSDDSHITAYRVGQRDAFRYIKSLAGETTS